jgi:hypothetical protein
MIPRFVLSMGFFFDFKMRNGIYEALARNASSKELMELVRKGTFSHNELMLLRKMVKKFHIEHRGVPIMIRSSAHGDAAGTGVYKSTIALNFNNEQKTLDGLIKAIKEVLASEFSKNVISFRNKLNLLPGMAVMIEPMFGQHTLPKPFMSYTIPEIKSPGTRCFTSVFGGFAYTSRGALPGYVFLSSGLPSNAVAGKGLRIELNDERPLVNIQFFESERLAGIQFVEDHSSHIVDTFGFKITNSDAIESLIPCQELPNNLRAYSLTWLFSKLKKLEEACGKPQYIEWAAIEENQQPKVALLQISDADLVQNDRHIEIVATEKTLGEAIYVTGSRTIDCEALVYINGDQAVSLMAELNERLRNYIVTYSSNIATANNSFLEASEVSNASVIAPFHVSAHSRLPEGHIAGKLNKTKTLLLGFSGFDFQKLGEPDEILPVRDGHGTIHIYYRKFKVISSEAQQKAVIDLE